MSGGLDENRVTNPMRTSPMRTSPMRTVWPIVVIFLGCGIVFAAAAQTPQGAAAKAPRAHISVAAKPMSAARQAETSARHTAITNAALSHFAKATLSDAGAKGASRLSGLRHVSLTTAAPHTAQPARRLHSAGVIGTAMSHPAKKNTVR